MIEPHGPAAELSAGRIIELYELMLAGRLFETRLHTMYRSGRLGGAVYPGVGQEAAMVGSAAALDDGDMYGGTHRDLTSQLTRGVTLGEAMLNFLGKGDGPSRGRDGNSHFGIVAKGTLTVVSPLPDNYPVAAGWALAQLQAGSDRVAMANCGEGASATGTWHEAVNTAAVLQLPIVFTVQNNQFAYSTANDGEFRGGRVADRAQAYGMPGVTVDGNDLFACYAAARDAVLRARAGGGPSLIEAVTFRHFGHAGHDPADYVPAEVRQHWMAADPLARIEEYLQHHGIVTEDAAAATRDRITADIKAAWDEAGAHPEPGPDEVTADLFAVRDPAPPPTPAAAEGEPVTVLDAINQTLGEEMARDESVFLLGEDIGSFGGAFKVTAGLFDRFGPERVIDTPIAESAIVGMAVGAALGGRRPVAELQYMDFIYAGLDQLVTEAGKYFWKAGRPVPLVLRGPAGAGLRAGPFHSISPEGLLAHHPGIKIACPSTPGNAKGLLLAALRDPNPVVYLEHKMLYRRREIAAPVPAAGYEVPLGRARVARTGADATVVTWSAMTHVALEAAAVLADRGIDLEVVDLQSIVPLDWEVVFASVEKTARLLVLQEDVPFASVASEVAAVVAAELFWNLDAPIVRLTPPHTHIPFAAALEDAFVPQPGAVVDAVAALAST